MSLQHFAIRRSGRVLRVPQWLLKSPAHLWHLDALLAEYPDALFMTTHRIR